MSPQQLRLHRLHHLNNIMSRPGQLVVDDRRWLYVVVLIIVLVTLTLGGQVEVAAVTISR
jgi:hypothetical protein